MTKYLILFISVFLVFINDIQASQSNANSSHPLSKKEIKRQKRAKKFIESKLGQWLIKRIAKKYQKRKERLEHKKNRKEGKGKTWKSKKGKIGWGYIVAMLLVVLALITLFILFIGVTPAEAILLVLGIALIFVINFIINNAEERAKKKEAL